MKTSYSLHTLMRGLVCLACLSFLSTGHAQTLIFESFNAAAPESTTPENWYSVNPAGTAIVERGGVNYQRLERPGSASTAVYYTGSQGDVTGGQILDFNAEMIVRFSGSNQTTTMRGVAIRTQSLDFAASGSTPFWGYTVGFVAHGNSNNTPRGLYIYENPTDYGTAARGEFLAYTPFAADLNSNLIYVFRVSAEGPILTASLWNEAGTVEYASVIFEEANEVAGFFGLWAANANSISGTDYRNLNLMVTAVPEVEVAGALMGLFGLLWGVRTRFKKK